MKRILSLALILALILLSGCAAPKKSADLVLAGQTMVGRYEADTFMALTKDDLLDLYGIKAEDVKQFSAWIARNSTLADEILLFEAVDSAAADRIKQRLDNRYQAKLNENKDYLPDEYEKVNACKVQKDGLYVAMIVSGDHEELEKIYKEAFV